MSSARSESSPYRGISSVGHRSSSRSIHPYFGKVDPAIAIRSVEEYSSAGDTVLDPFCGSGTVLHDALLLGRCAIGWDSSPLAVMIAAGKILGVTRDEHLAVKKFRQDLLSLGDRLGEANEYEVPSMPRVRATADWFTQNAMRELALIRRAIQAAEKELPAEAVLLLRIAFSRIIVQASNQQGESTYRKIEKADYAGRALELYGSAIDSVLKAASSFNEELARIGLSVSAGRLTLSDGEYCVNHGKMSARLVVRDARQGEVLNHAPMPSLVVTSPPYLMSWDYGLYHKFRFYWLGLDLDAYEATEIGRHLRRRKDDVERYAADMAATFASLGQNTSDSAHIVMVNAPSVVYGEEVDTSSLLISVAQSNGWRCRWSGPTLDIPGPHHGMYGSLAARGASAPGKAGKREEVLVFERSC